MRRRTLTTLLAATLFAAAAPRTFACGESLYRLGRGIAYRSYSAPLPANVIVFVRSDAERAFARQLADAGHQVRTVDNSSQLAASLRAAQFPDTRAGRALPQVVIAPAAQLEGLDDRLLAASRPASIIPVVDPDTPAATTRRGFSPPLASEDGLKAFRKAIHRSVKSA